MSYKDLFVIFMERNYNLERKKLQLPEYGRHIHQMVDYLFTIEDRETRNKQAQVVIEVMGNLNPVLRDTADFKHKLWDHLLIMSGFQLDIDSPYPAPKDINTHPKPDTLTYPSRKIAYKYYGKNVAAVLGAIKEIEDPEMQAQAISDIAKYMRAKVFEYNQKHPNNQTIIQDILTLSNHEIVVDESLLESSKSEPSFTPTNHRTRKNNTSGHGSSKTASRTERHNNNNNKRKTGRMQHKS